MSVLNKKQLRLFHFSLYLLYLVFLPFSSTAQQSLQEYLELLKDESRSQVFSAQKAYAMLNTLPTEQLATALEKEVVGKSTRLQARAKALVSRFLFYRLGPGDSLYAARMKEALDAAYSIDDPFMIAEFSRWYGEMLNSLGNAPLAAQYCMNALKMQKELGLENFYTPKTFYLTTAEMLYHTQNYDKACQYFREAFELPDDSISLKQYGEFKIQVAHSLNAVGRAFHALKKYDTAVNFLVRCMQYVDHNKLGAELHEMAYYNRFDPLLELGQYDSCRIIAEKLFVTSHPLDSVSLLGACFMKARIALRSKKIQEAIKWGLKAEQYGKNTPQLLFYVYKDLSTSYLESGNDEKAAAYLEKWRLLDEMNNKIKQQASAAFLEAESEFQKSRIKLSRLQVQQKRQLLRRNLFIAVTLLIALCMLYFMNQRRKRSEKKIEQIQDQFHFFETGYHNAKEQLEQFKKEVAEKNRQVQLLVDEKTTTADKQAHAAKIDHLSRQIILTEKDWDIFRDMFNEVFPVFITALKIQAPDITHAEIRMACLIKLNFDSKHIAGMLGISQDTVRKTRYRLKKRFSNYTEAALEDIIAGI